MMKLLNADFDFRISGDTTFNHKLFDIDGSMHELLHKNMSYVQTKKKLIPAHSTIQTQALYLSSVIG